MRNRIETVNTLRRRSLVRAAVILVSTVALSYWWCAHVAPDMAAHGPRLTDSAVLAIALVIVGSGAVLASMLLLLRPSPLVRGTSTRRFSQAPARILVNRIRRYWITYCRQAGLDVSNRNGTKVTIDVPRVVSLRPCALGVEAIVSTVAGRPPAQLVERAPYLSSALGVHCRVEPTGPTMARVIAVLQDPLDQVITIEQFPDLEPEQMSLSFGMREDGLPAVWSWKEKSGAVIGGEPGAGKTASATVLVGPLLLSQYADVHIIDGKGGQDWSWAKRCATSFTNDALNFEEVAAMVERFESRMLTRLQFARNDGETSNFWARTRTPGEPFELLVIDECQTYFNAAGRSPEIKKIVQKIAASVENVVRKGRSAGYAVLLMSQKPTADSIPTSLRDNAGLRMAFKVNTRAAEEAVLGELPEHTDDHLRAVNISEVGRAVANEETGRRVLIRSAYMDEATARTRMSEFQNQKEATRKKTCQ